MNLSTQKMLMIYSKQIDISTALSLDCVKRAHVYKQIPEMRIEKKMMK